MKVLIAIAMVLVGGCIVDAIGGPFMYGAVAGAFVAIFLYSASLGETNRKYRASRGSSDVDFDGDSGDGGGD